MLPQELAKCWNVRFLLPYPRCYGTLPLREEAYKPLSRVRDTHTGSSTAPQHHSTGGEQAGARPTAKRRAVNGGRRLNVRASWKSRGVRRQTSGARARPAAECGHPVPLLLHRRRALTRLQGWRDPAERQEGLRHSTGKTPMGLGRVTNHATGDAHPPAHGQPEGRARP